uniref:RRM domain-containing protein n=1 Tax=Polytomella parva TaxID=51329 RepID=A0A7S0YDF2_9CHLO|mmetsp:Transcript_19337/g.34918  ORF Transcript_19337/g.34918 Transcript_19337/m.34918 type:complete len:179 (+) Transcript_19337:53-589(+)
MEADEAYFENYDQEAAGQTNLEEETGIPLSEQEQRYEGVANDETLAASAEDKAEVDKRSIFISQVDYGCGAEELCNFFTPCGSIKRVTIKSDSEGNPKGFAYIEFDDIESVVEALKLDGQILRGRKLKVLCKRTNIVGMKSRRGGRGGPMGRGYGRGYGWYGGRGRGRGRASPYYHPY